MKAVLVALLLSGAGLAALPAASAHTVYCDFLDPICLAGCVGPHPGFPGPHYCAVEQPEASVEPCPWPESGYVVTVDDLAVHGCFWPFVWIEPCDEGFGWYVHGQWFILDACFPLKEVLA